MTEPRRILVTGASIAGNTVAYWLARHGCQVELVEQAEAFRDGGQNIDVRGAGREVLRRMGLEDAANAAGTHEAGTAWVDDDGCPIARFTTDDVGADGITAEIEILRGDLARLIHQAALGRGVTCRFGDRIAAIEEDGIGVAVTFAAGTTQRYDLIVVAEGVGSATRDLVLPGIGETRWMDVSIGYFDIPARADDSDLWLWYHTTGGHSASLRPGVDGRTMALLTISRPSAGEHKWDAARQKAFLREEFVGVGWQVPRILDGLADAGWFYFDALRQMRLPRWSAGRVVLTGDAAWCATPIAGIGTTLALTGGYVLAGEIIRHGDPAAAFAAYDRFMRPTVSKKQNIPKFLPRLMNPHSRIGLSLFHAMLRMMGLPGVRNVAGRMFLGASLDVDLPKYAVDDEVNRPGFVGGPNS